jgi:hypothetical protein
MLYKFLGMVVWNGAKFVLRRKYGSMNVTKPLVAGGVLALVLGLAAILRGQQAR